ncbi:ABC transporter [Streptomyces alboflavus]|uniref:ABC transporter n=1 Tax=Streptomyces alboflavus TaxID=67267 RepID=A0A1Z1WPW9_9ACTN|nr:ABC transporter [Streptomyces alboflavus]
MLELRSLTAGYDRRDPVVREVSLTVGPGESVGLLGPSGCGKSTLARVAALLHRPDRGQVVIDGEPARGWRHRARRAQRTAFGVVFQQPRLSADPRLTLTQLIAEPLRATGRGAEAPDRVRELARTVGLGGTCSPAARTRSATASSNAPAWPGPWSLRPRWLICDEMTAMLDASTTAALVTAVEDYRADSGAGLLAVGHDKVLLERWCDRTVHWDELTRA